MRETDRIADQLRRAFEGTAWHGPSLMEILNDLTAEVAAAKPVPAAHSIWEIVLHISTWEREGVKELQGVYAPPSPEEDWPAVNDTSATAWEATLDGVTQTHRELLQVVSGLDDVRLAEKVSGGRYSVYLMLHGIVQHLLYHAGQIALLKKALERRETGQGASG